MPKGPREYFNNPLAMESLIATSLFLGFTLGVAHACDPDHLVAVGTLTAESKNVRQASVLGMIWGVGHTIALGLIGVLSLNMKRTVPDQFSIAIGSEIISELKI